LKAIIDERPNAVPVGVGNNSSGYDASILARSENTSEVDWSDPGLGLYTFDDHDDGGLRHDSDHDGEGNSDDEDGDNNLKFKLNSEGSDEGENSEIEDVTMENLKPEVPSKTPSMKTPTVMKRKATAIEAPKTIETKPPKTSARAGKSTPAAVTTTASQRASKKPKTAIEKINAITVKEEETTQKMLELKKLKVKGENDKVLARIKAKADVKIQQMKLRAELAQKKLDNEFRLQMARMGHDAGSSSTVHSNTAPPGSGYSDAGSVTPSAYSSELPVPQVQVDPSLEFFGQSSGYDFHFHD
jgi:hypothetical protein